MKIALVSPYGESQTGGIVNWTKHIINYQRKCEDDIDIRLVYNKSAKSYRGKGHIVYQIFAGIANYIPVCIAFRKLSRQEHLDIVHICSSAYFGLLRDFYIIKVAHRRGIKTAIHLHFGSTPRKLSSSGWEHNLFVRVLAMVDRVLVMDMTSYNTLMEYGYKNINYLPNPLGETIQQLVSERINVQRDPGKIVFAGHIVKTKGVFELVEACRSIKGIKLELLGIAFDNSIKNELFVLAGKGSEQWLSMPGNKSIDEVVEAMMTCSLFVLPSYIEGFPNVILESMACGCPIISTPVGAIPEMLAIDSKEPCGICVEPKSIHQLHDAIERLLNDKTLACVYGERARKRVNEKYTISIVWEQLVGIWRSLKNDEKSYC